MVSCFWALLPCTFGTDSNLRTQFKDGVATSSVPVPRPPVFADETGHGVEVEPFPEWGDLPWDDEFFPHAGSLLEEDAKTGAAGQDALADGDLGEAQLGWWESRRRDRRRRTVIPESVQETAEEFETKLLDVAEQMRQEGANCKESQKAIILQSEELTQTEKDFLLRQLDEGNDIMQMAESISDGAAEGQNNANELSGIGQMYADFVTVEVYDESYDDMTVEERREASPHSPGSWSLVQQAQGQHKRAAAKLASDEAAAARYGSVGSVLQVTKDDVGKTRSDSREELSKEMGISKTDMDRSHLDTENAIETKEFDVNLARDTDKNELEHKMSSYTQDTQRLYNDIRQTQISIESKRKTQDDRAQSFERSAERTGEDEEKNINDLIGDSDKYWEKQTKTGEKSIEELNDSLERRVEELLAQGHESLGAFDEGAIEKFENFEDTVGDSVKETQDGSAALEKQMEERSAEVKEDLGTLTENIDHVKDGNALVQDLIHANQEKYMYTEQKIAEDVSDETKASADKFNQDFTGLITFLKNSMQSTDAETNGHILDTVDVLRENIQKGPEELAEMKRGFLQQMQQDLEQGLKDSNDLSTAKSSASSALQGFLREFQTLDKAYQEAFGDVSADAARSGEKLATTLSRDNAALNAELQRSGNFMRGKAETLSGMVSKVSQAAGREGDAIATAMDRLQTVLSKTGLTADQFQESVKREATALANKANEVSQAVTLMKPNNIEPLRRDYMKSATQVERAKNVANNSWTKAEKEFATMLSSHTSNFRQHTSDQTERVVEAIVPGLQEQMVEEQKELMKLRDGSITFDTASQASNDEILSRLDKIASNARPLAAEVANQQEQLEKQQQAVEAGLQVFGPDQITRVKTETRDALAAARSALEGKLAEEVAHERTTTQDAITTNIDHLESELAAAEEELNGLVGGSINSIQKLSVTTKGRLEEIEKTKADDTARASKLADVFYNLRKYAEHESNEIARNADHAISSSQQAMKDIQRTAADEMSKFRKQLQETLHSTKNTFASQSEEYETQISQDVVSEKDALEKLVQDAKRRLQTMAEEQGRVSLQAESADKTAAAYMEGGQHRWAHNQEELNARLTQSRDQLGSNSEMTDQLEAAESRKGVSDSRMTASLNVLGGETGSLAQQGADAADTIGNQAFIQIKQDSAKNDLFMSQLAESERAALEAQRDRDSALANSVGSVLADIDVVQIKSLREDNMTRAEQNSVVELINSEREMLEDNWAQLEKFLVTTQERVVESLNRQTHVLSNVMAQVSMSCNEVEEVQAKTEARYQEVSGSEAFKTLQKIQQADQFASAVMNEGYIIEQWMAAFVEDAKPWRARVEEAFKSSEEAADLFAMEQDIAQAENEARVKALQTGSEGELEGMVAEVSDGTGLAGAAEGFDAAMNAFEAKMDASDEMDSERISTLTHRVSDTTTRFASSYDGAKVALKTLLNMDAGQHEKVNMITTLLSEIMVHNADVAAHAQQVVKRKQQMLSDSLIYNEGQYPPEEALVPPTTAETQSLVERVKALEAEHTALENRHAQLGAKIQSMSSQMVAALKLLDANMASTSLVEAKPHH